MNKILGVLSLIFGILFIAIGIAELMASLGIYEAAYIPADIFGAFSGIVTASVFLVGASNLLKNKDKGMYFLMVGSLLGVILGLLYIVIPVSGGLDTWILNTFAGESGEWSFMDGFRYEILLFVPSLLAYLGLRKSVNKITA